MEKLRCRRCRHTATMVRRSRQDDDVVVPSSWNVIVRNVSASSTARNALTFSGVSRSHVGQRQLARTGRQSCGRVCGVMVLSIGYGGKVLSIRYGAGRGH
jgi:hypothetical protein